MKNSISSLFAMAAVVVLVGACGKSERNEAPPVIPYADGEIPKLNPKSSNDAGPALPSADPSKGPLIVTPKNAPSLLDPKLNPPLTIPKAKD